MTHRLRKSVAALAACVLVLGAIAGCAPNATTTGTTGTGTTPVAGGTMSYYIGDPAAIDPYNAQETEGVTVVHQLFKSLTAFDSMDASKLLPAAASSWSANADATVWTFKLDPNDKFSDGTPVTAKDFVYAWNRIADPKTLNTATKKVDPSTISYHLAPVMGYDAVQAGTATGMAGLKAVDDLTFEVTLSKPFGDFEYVVAHPALAPVEQALVENGVDYNGAKVAFGDMPVGNGPFKMAEPWKHGQYVKVIRNDAFDGTKPLLDGVNFMTFKDPDTAYLEFQSGNLDFAQISLGKIADAKAKYGTSSDGYTANPNAQVLLGAEDSVYYLVVNNKDAAMSNLNLRKAVSLGINRQAICDALFEGTRAPADNIVPPGIAGYEPGVWAFAKYDTTAAAQALVDAGFPGGKGAPQIALTYNADGGHQKIMELVQSDLTKLGLKVKLAPLTDFPTYLKALGAGSFMIGRLGWVADYPIFDNFMNPLFNSTSTDNYSKYSDPAVDAAIVAARKITDTAARIAAYQAIDKTIGEAVPDIPLMFYQHHHVTSARVHDFVFSSMYLADFSKTWLSK
jgi:peptide/nickel transport system substrate-binding protein/oligopeptide transport system substrate-binding protein